MAIYHLSAKVIGRAGGRSSVAAAAYRTAGRLRDTRQGIEHDYSRKGGVVHTEILAPETAPDWMRDRDQLRNAVEAVEKRKDAQLAREIEVALPRELDRDQRLDLLRGFVRREFVDRGMIADVAVHETKARDGQGQPHAHIMLTMRELAGAGFGKKDRSWNAPDVLVGWRAAWARDANAALERAGQEARIDHRTLDAQRETTERAAEQARDNGQEALALEFDKKVIQLDREPEPKIGPAAQAQEKRGLQTERGAAFRDTQARNAARQDVGWRQLELRFELVARGRAFVDAAKQRLDGLWGRVEAAMDRIKARVMGDADRDGSGTVERGQPTKDGREDAGRETASDDNAVRRAAVLGRSPEDEVARQAQAIDPNRSDPVDLDRRDAILGRHRDTGQTGGQERRPDRGKGRDRER